MLKITRSSKVLIPKTFRIDNDKIVRVSNRGDKTFKNLSKSKKLKNKRFKNLIYIKAIEELIFLTPNTKKLFNYLKQKFIKAPIL